MEGTRDRIIQIGQIYGTQREPNPKAGRVFSIEGLSPCLGTVSGGNTIPMIKQDIRIRRLTPKECFKLQGWTDDYFEKAAFVNLDSQLYKQAGNGVTVNVVQAIGELIGK